VIRPSPSDDASIIEEPRGNELEAVETSEGKKRNDDVPRFDPSFGARGSRSMGVDEAV
jgi:hypothetical protein